MTKAAIWTRVSTTEQETANQVAQLEKWAEQRGLEVVKVYQVQESAFRGAQRDALEEVYRDSHQGQYHVLLIWALDRLTREGIRATLNIIKRITDSGVELLSYQEPWLTTTTPEMRDLLLSLFGWVAQQESRRLSERTKSGMAQAARRGVKMGRSTLDIFFYCARCKKCRPAAHFQEFGHKQGECATDRVTRLLPEQSSLGITKFAELVGLDPRSIKRLLSS